MNSNFSFTVLLGNEQIARDFAITSIPVTIVIDKKGFVVAYHRGFSFELFKKMEEKIKSLL